MSAETDIAAIDDGGANTASEVRTALTSVLTATPEWVQYLDHRLSSETAHADDDFFDDADNSGYTTVDPTGSATWTEKYGVQSVKFSGQSSNDLAGLIKALTPSTYPVTIETSIAIAYPATTNNFAGVVLSDGTSATSNLIYLCAYNGSSTSVLQLFTGTFTALSGAASITWHNNVPPAVYARLYMRLVWTAANTFKPAFSIDAVTWVDFALGSATPTLTPTYYGLGVTKYGQTGETVASFGPIRVYESDLSV